MSDLIVEHADQILKLTFNRPAVLNALTWEMIRETKRHLEAARSDRQTRVVLIAGAGDHFCSGADIRVEKNCSLAEYREFVGDIQDITIALRRLDAVSIAVIQGYSLGGGAEIACACDLRIAADDARIGFPEVGLGLSITSGASQILPRLVGAARAKELTLLGNPVEAQEALRIGLVNRVVARSELEKEARDWAEKIKARPPLSLATQKHLIDAGAESGLEPVLGYEVDAILTVFASKDGQEGMEAFLEKRKPRFVGE